MDTPALTITFLGTGTSSGIPMIACPCKVCHSADRKDKRLRSSILIQSATTAIAIDAGPDFRYQMLRATVLKLDGIIFTHPHKDHVAGLDDVRAFNYFSGREMNVYANEMTQAVLIREFPYAFGEFKHAGVPEIILNTIDAEPFVVGDIPVIPVMVWHLKMPVLGFRFGNFTYITDANRIEEREMDKIKGSTVVVLNALRKGKHISHFNLEEAIRISRTLNPSRTLFTHLSHQMGLHQEVNGSLPAGIELAYDQQTISV